MNRPSTEEIKHALRYARHRISTRKEKFICLALPSNSAGEWLRNYIMQSMGCSASNLDFWVWGKVYDCRYGTYPSLEQMRLYRLRWIDWMLDQ